VTLRPCLSCGEPSEETRCWTCARTFEARHDAKPSARIRGYSTSWDRLSKRARRLQPWCLHCGATDDLQTDHTPAAWERHEAGLAVRLEDVQVLCGPCNRAAGAARPTGDDPHDQRRDPWGKAESRSLSGGTG